MVIPAESFDPDATLRAIEDERCTSIYGVPTMFIAQLDIPSLRALSASTRCAPASWPAPLSDRGHATGHRPHARAGGHDRLRHDRSVARCRSSPRSTIRSSCACRRSAACCPHLECKIVDPATGAIVPRGAPGRALHAGLRRDARLLEQCRGDRRGDRRGALDAHRRPGRHARRRLLQHHGPHQGHDHPRRREHLSARDRRVPVHASEDQRRAGDRRARSASTAKKCAPGSGCARAQDATEEELRDFCRGQIATYKIPRYIRFTTEFPTTVTGKIQKFRMREISVEELGLSRVNGIETA